MRRFISTSLILFVALMSFADRLSAQPEAVARPVFRSNVTPVPQQSSADQNSPASQSSPAASQQAPDNSFFALWEKPDVPQPTKTLKLYPKGQNVDMGIVENGKPVTLGPGESNGLSGEERVIRDGWIFNINDNARINIYLPEKPNGQMVVVTPGGGYEFVSSWNEGEYVAKWLNERGIAACTVYYRLPNKHYNVPLTDVQNAFRYCRAHAAEWGIKQIGIMGFSAGGHLAAYASNCYVDRVTRPDFSILVYPVITLEKGQTHEGTRLGLVGDDRALADFYSMERRVSPNTPPTLLLLSADDDTVPTVSSTRYYHKLVEKKVPANIHIFPTGGHGYGFTTSDLGTDGLGKHRELFFDCLQAFLDDVKR